MKATRLLCVVVGFAATAAIAAADDGVPFNGRTTCAEVSAGQAFDLEQFTLAARVKLRRVDGSQVFINRGRPGDLFTLYLYQGRVRMLVEYKPGRYSHADAPQPAVNEWAHYAGTYDGKQIKVYLNGKLAATVEAPGRIPRSSVPLYIGCSAPGERILDGWIDDVQVWRLALPDAEIARIAAGDAPSAQEGLVGRWTADSFEEGTWRNEVSADLAATYQTELKLAVRKADGYRGIWYSNQRQDDEYVYKYSGGLGTYCAKHIPLAVYSKEANKTFFCYGGTDPEGKTLLHMVSYYDHTTGMVPRPTILLDKHTDDAHDNPVLGIDDKGHIWIFSSSHGTARPSYISVSKRPYDIDEFEHVATTNFSYTQPHYLSGQGFFFIHTRYAGGRCIYQMMSPDGRDWTEPQLLAKIEQGHYQISWAHGKKVGVAFNFHPHPHGLNWRTNLYYMESDDFGKTWRNIVGEELELPLTSPDNPALVYNYREEKRNVYMKDLAFDAAGRPIILFLTSGGWESGPKNDPRIWCTARWTGAAWEIHGSIESDNNYDMGSLYVERDDQWRIIAPTQDGPQRYNTGGEVALWISSDQGRTWTMKKQLTRNSQYNHTYCRKPVNAHPDFYAFWADGHAREKSPSRLYFTDKEGTHVWRLPVNMESDFARPEIVHD